MTPERMTQERLGPFTFYQTSSGHKVTNDPILLVDFIPTLSADDRVVDLGTGTGVIPLLLAWKTPAGSITGVEVDGGAASLAGRNVKENGLSGRVRVVEADIRELDLPRGSFSVVVSNPPYMRAGAGRLSPVEGRRGARSEVNGTITDFVRAASFLADMDGRVYFVYPVKRLGELLGELQAAGLKPRRLRFVHTRPGRAASLFLIEAGRDGGSRWSHLLFYEFFVGKEGARTWIYPWPWPFLWQSLARRPRPLLRSRL